MNNKELRQIIIEFANENNLRVDDCVPISKEDLKIGKLYKGSCRNASYAEWNGVKFLYERYKFGNSYIEFISSYIFFLIIQT